MKKVVILILCLMFTLCPGLAEVDENYVPHTYEDIQGTWGEGETLVIDGVCEITVDGVKFGSTNDFYPDGTVFDGTVFDGDHVVAVWVTYKNNSDFPVRTDVLSQQLTIEKYWIADGTSYPFYWMKAARLSPMECVMGLEYPGQMWSEVDQKYSAEFSIMPGESKPLVVYCRCGDIDETMILMPWALSVKTGDVDNRYRIGRFSIGQGEETQYTEYEWPGLRAGVCMLKTALNQLGYYSIAPDYSQETLFGSGYTSHFDDALVEAIQQFQAAEGLEATGIADEKTFSRIYDILILISLGKYPD